MLLWSFGSVQLYYILDEHILYVKISTASFHCCYPGAGGQAPVATDGIDDDDDEVPGKCDCQESMDHH